MITVNVLKISPDRTKIDVSISAASGDNITKFILWNEDTFKDYTQAIDLSSKLSGLTNNEVFSITASEANVASFDGLYFMEITSTNTVPLDCSTCQDPLLAVVADLSIYREVLLKKILKLNICSTNIFEGDLCSDNAANNIININLLLEAILTSLQLGYYSDSLDLLKSLKKLINVSNCEDCGTYEYSTFISGLNYGILNGTLILN